MNDDTPQTDFPDQPTAQITITFGPGHHVELEFTGVITSYMMLGAAGVITEQANDGIRDTLRGMKQAATGRQIERVQSVPTDIRRPGS